MTSFAVDFAVYSVAGLLSRAATMRPGEPLRALTTDGAVTRGAAVELVTISLLCTARNQKAS